MVKNLDYNTTTTGLLVYGKAIGSKKTVFFALSHTRTLCYWSILGLYGLSYTRTLCYWSILGLYGLSYTRTLCYWYILGLYGLSYTRTLCYWFTDKRLCRSLILLRLYHAGVKY